jgi:cytochrome P450
MQDTEQPPVIPFDRARLYDPPAQLLDWQHRAPIMRVRLWHGGDAWLITGFEEIREILRDHKRFSSAPDMPGYPSLSPADAAAKNVPLLVFQDPPVHDLLRRSVQKEFTVRRADTMRDDTQAIVGDLLDGLTEMPRPVDLVPAFAALLPARFTCRLLGVPIEDADFFRERLSRRFDPKADQVSVTEADAEVTDYFRHVIQDRLAHARDDLSGRLATDYVATGQIEHDTAAVLLYQLLIGGFDTTRNMLSMSVVLLTEQPEALARLRAEPELWNTAIEELLRYLCVLQFNRRAVTEDVVVAGHLFQKGEGVMTSLSAANRDRRAYENAGSFDPTRRVEPSHMAFGHGIHACLGQHVARMQLRLALPQLFDRIPTLALATPLPELEYRPGANVVGPSRLSVTW